MAALSADKRVSQYEFPLYGNPEYILSGNQTDSSELIRAYLNLYHTTQPDGKTMNCFQIKSLLYKGRESNG